MQEHFARWYSQYIICCQSALALMCGLVGLTITWGILLVGLVLNTILWRWAATRRIASVMIRHQRAEDEARHLVNAARQCYERAVETRPTGMLSYPRGYPGTTRFARRY